jgi:hypothetical protein
MRTLSMGLRLVAVFLVVGIVPAFAIPASTGKEFYRLTVR